jgi:branched-chain amino acid transport system substrate-binding protein
MRVDVRYRFLPVLLLLGCSDPSTSAITFGAAGPWTEDYGAMNRRGIELAVDEINARARWKDRPLRIEFRDDGGDGVRATEIARGFVMDPRILAVVGHVNSGAMVSAARVYDGQLPAVATTASAPGLTGISRWTFRVISSDSANGADIARFATKRGYQRVAVLYENNPYGRGLTDAFRRAFSGEIVTMDPIGDDGQQTFEPFVTYYKTRGLDAIFVAGTNSSGRAFLREARAQRLATALIGGDGWSTLAGDTVNAEGIYVGAPFSVEDTSAGVKEFVDKFRKRFKATPDHNAALAYDATMLLADAVERGAVTRERMRNHLAGLDASSAFAGVTGRIRFNEGGDPVGKSIVMTRIKAGALLVEAER